MKSPNGPRRNTPMTTTTTASAMTTQRRARPVFLAAVATGVSLASA